LRHFDCCCLSLQPCKNPVITPDGYLFDKESVLEYVITKKNEVSRQMKEFEKQKRREDEEVVAQITATRKEHVSNFVKQEGGITVGSNYTPKRAAETPSISNMAAGKEKNVPSFWIPSQTPQAKKSKTIKPDKTVYCPMSGKPLKIKDLIPVKFTEIKDPADKRSLIAKDARYMCPISRDTLSNSIPCAVIRTTGDVVTMECVEKIIKKDWLHPFTGDKLTENDIILVQRGATGFSSTNDNLEAKEARPVLQV